jgi:hypothetical protein
MTGLRVKPILNINFLSCIPMLGSFLKLNGVSAVRSVEGDTAVGIEMLPTFTTAELVEQLQPHFEAIESNPKARPQPMLLACLLQQQDEGEDKKDCDRHESWVEDTRGFVVVRGWSAQAAPMVSDGVPLVRKERDGHHDTMVAPDAGGGVVVHRLKRERKSKKPKPVPKPLGPPEALIGMSGGADVIAILRHGLLDQQQDLPGADSVDDGLKLKKKKGVKAARALRSNRELWRQQLKALLSGLSGGGEEAGRWYGRPTPLHCLHLAFSVQIDRPHFGHAGFGTAYVYWTPRRVKKREQSPAYCWMR